MFAWGAVTIGSSGVTNFGTLAVTRFLLGVFEAGKSSIQAQSYAVDAEPS